MAKFCANCGKKRSFRDRFFYSDKLCNECAISLDSKLRADKKERDAQLALIERSIKMNHACTPQEVGPLKRYPHNEVRDLYGRLYNQFANNRELHEQDLRALLTLQRATGLTDTEIHFEELVKPYYYVNSIRNGGTLPTINLQIGGVGAPILRRGEVVYYGYSATLYNIKTVINKNPGGVQGVNFRVTKGVNYRAGAWKNAAKGGAPLHVQGKHASSGVLVVTNRRVFMHPAEGRAPISISLNKVLSFNCNENGILIWIEGRQKTYFFVIPNHGAIEIFGLCLIFLLDAEARPQYAQKERSPFRSIPTEVKNRVLVRDGGRCVMCGSNEGIHFDHIIPVVKSGDNTEDNIQILCKECNLRKYDKII